MTTTIKVDGRYFPIVVPFAAVGLHIVQTETQLNVVFVHRLATEENGLVSLARARKEWSGATWIATSMAPELVQFQSTDHGYSVAKFVKQGANWVPENEASMHIADARRSAYAPKATVMTINDARSAVQNLAKALSK